MTHSVLNSKDTMQNILCFLYPLECIKTERVCKGWHTIVDAEKFWKILCQVQKIPLDPACTSVSSFKYQATLLYGEATLAAKVFKTEKCNPDTDGICTHRLELKIKMRPISKELRIIVPDPVCFWVPLKYFYDSDGNIKQTGTCLKIKYSNRLVVLTIRDSIQNNSTHSVARSFHEELRGGITECSWEKRMRFGVAQAQRGARLLKADDVVQVFAIKISTIVS